MARAGLTSATTYSASLILPPHSVPLTLPCLQVPIGDNLLNRLETVNYDPFSLYPDFIRNRNLAFIGDVGNGKSASMKTFLERMLIVPERLGRDAETGAVITRRRRAVIIDRKGEYRRLAEQFDCRPAVLGHGQCINPFDARLSEQQQLAVLESFLRLLLDRVLSPFELKCVECAYGEARRRWTAALQTLPPPGQTRREHFLLVDVRHALMHLPDDFVRDSLHSRREVDRTASELAFALDQLLTGSQRGMFDGPTTDALDWRGQVVDIVVHPDYLTGNRHLIYQLMVVCVAVWLDQAWQAVDASERVDFFVCDEVWDLVKVRQFAEQLQECTKLGRSRGLCVLIAFHGPTDFRSAGDHGQAQVEMAERMLKDVDSFFLFRMSEDDATLLKGIVRLTDDDIETIQNMEPHQFLLVLGSGSSRRRFLVLHRITKAEQDMVDTDRLDLAVKSFDDTQEQPAQPEQPELPAQPRKAGAEERLRLPKYDPERLTRAEQRLYADYYRHLMSSDDAVVVIHPQKRAVYMRLVAWVVAGIAGLLLLWGFVALFASVTGGLTTTTSSTVPIGPTSSAVSLGTVFPHPPSTGVSPVTTASTTGRIGAGGVATGGLILILVVFAALGAIGYWLYLRLVVRNHYISISKKLININNALLQRDPQTLPIDRFSDGRYVQPYVSFVLSRGNRNLAWSWGNRFEIDTPGAQRNVRLDQVPQPRVVMALITQLFRNTVTPTFQGLQRQVALAQAQYGLAAQNSGVEPDPDLMKPWPPPPPMPSPLRQPPGET